MTDHQAKTRELLEKLATTDYRRSLRADQIFRGLREEAEARAQNRAPLPQRGASSV
jgi:hypothetical protein